MPQTYSSQILKLEKDHYHKYQKAAGEIEWQIYKTERAS